MANRPNQFKHRDIVRAFKAAEAAGVPNPSVRFQCPNGTVITIDSKPDKVAAVLSKPGKVRQPAARGKAMKPKKTSVQHGAKFARGGDDHMVKPQAAGPVKGGHTGKIQSVAPGAKSAKGGAKTSGYSLALPAKAGHTSQIKKGR